MRLFCSFSPCGMDSSLSCHINHTGAEEMRIPRVNHPLLYLYPTSIPRVNHHLLYLYPTSIPRVNHPLLYLYPTSIPRVNHPLLYLFY